LGVDFQKDLYNIFMRSKGLLDFNLGFVVLTIYNYRVITHFSSHTTTTGTDLIMRK
jgi:hypothetical protein